MTPLPKSIAQHTKFRANSAARHVQASLLITSSALPDQGSKNEYGKDYDSLSKKHYLLKNSH